MSANLDRLEELAGLDRHLGVLITTNADGSPQVSVVNVGQVVDPGTGDRVVALVARPGAKTRNLARRPVATLVVRAGWEWMSVRGIVTVIDAANAARHGLDRDHYRDLLRDIFAAAGGSHPDLDEYDRVMAAERRCAVLIRPERFTSNPAGADHKEPNS